jgi:hypothetical protein
MLSPCPSRVRLLIQRWESVLSMDDGLEDGMEEVEGGTAVEDGAMADETDGVDTSDDDGGGGAHGQPKG